MIEFGQYIFDEQTGRLLTKNNYQEVQIDPKLFELLTLFVEQPNKILSRQYLLDHLWPNSLVTDNAINKSVGNLRQALGDNAKSAKYIQTVPKRGYRLICDVSKIDVLKQNVNIRQSTEKESRSAPYSLKHLGLLSIVLMLSIFTAWVWLVNDDQVQNNNHSIALTRAQGAELSPQMHPNNQHLYYIKKNAENDRGELWVKNIDTGANEQINLDNDVFQIFAVVERDKTNQTRVFFIDKRSNQCSVHQVDLSFSSLKQTIEPEVKHLFDCGEKKIRDAAFHPVQKLIYYSAQPQDFWPNQIYAFDLLTKKHRLVSQDEPRGWGHHNIDMFPNGEKLLIMSTDNDHKTQLIALDLLTNKMTQGIKFDRPVVEAIWHHDSQHVYYHAPAPAQQIIQSELNGENAIAIVNIAQPISSQMSRVPDGQNIVFSTEQKNLDIRWLEIPSNQHEISNSTVNDTLPILFHDTEQYLITSDRDGLMQLYLSDYQSSQTRKVTDFEQLYSIRYASISSDDAYVLINADQNVYRLPIKALLGDSLLKTLSPEYIIYSSDHPIIALDWYANRRAAVTEVINAQPSLVVINGFGKKLELPEGKWAYGLTDSAKANNTYLVEQRSNILFNVSPNKALSAAKTIDDKQAIPLIESTNISLPEKSYHVKIDDGILYYVTTENSLEYLNVRPLALNNEYHARRKQVNGFANYDLSRQKIMVSDTASIEGDIHKTVF